MKTRVISGTVIGVLTVVFGLLGGPALGMLLMICACAAYLELTKAMGLAREGGAPGALQVTGLVFTVAYYVALVLSDHFFGGVPHAQIALFAVVACFIVMMAFYVLRFPRFHAGQITAAVFCFLYAPVLMSFIYRARLLPYGMFAYALIFFCSWICDTCAYFTGRLLGRHKMAPVLSPKKTIEGAVGGILGSALFCFLTAIAMEKIYPDHQLGVRVGFAVIGLIGGLISQIGDLAASAIKRDYGIKDYGNLIPGHGGMMDRFDSAIYMAPVIYFLATVVLK